MGRKKQARKIPLPRQPKPADDTDSDDDDLLEAEDVRFFMGASADFLANMQLDPTEKKRNPSKRKRQGKVNEDVDEDELEAEMKPRGKSSNWEAQEKAMQRMPIKTQSGLALPKISEEGPDDEDTGQPDTPILGNMSKKARKKARREQTKLLRAQSKDGDSSKQDDEGEEEHKEEEEEQTELEAYISQEEKLATMKSDIASSATTILGDPETHIGKLHGLIDLLNCQEEGIKTVVQRLAMMSLSALYKDIIPGYRIRELSDAEKNVQVKKETKKLRKFEQGLLASYQQYLSVLYKKINAAKRHNATKSVQHTAFLAGKCLSTLLTSAPHFNFRNNIIDLMVTFASEYDPKSGTKLGDISGMFCKTLSQLFEEDEVYSPSLETVRDMARVIKSRSYKVPEELVHTMLALRLKESYIKEHRESLIMNKAKKKQHRSRKEKKQAKADKVLDAQLREVEAELSRKESGKLQTDILNLVFLTYFRVIKNAPHAPILPAVLEGLSKYAHLIDASFFGDLMTQLQFLISENEYSLEVSLQCVKTACLILSGQGAALTIDPKAFHNVLYSSMLELTGQDKEALLALHCLELMLIRRTEISGERVAAFSKRLAALSLQGDAHQSVSFLAAFRRIIHKYPAVTSMLDSDTLGVGIYNPDSADPELANAMGTTMWELALLQRHYHPFVSQHATHLAHGAPSTGRFSLSAAHALTSPREMFKACDLHNGSLNPPMKDPKIHPLVQSAIPGKPRTRSLTALTPVKGSDMSTLITRCTMQLDKDSSDIDSSFQSHFSEFRNDKLEKTIKVLRDRSTRSQAALNEANRRAQERKKAATQSRKANLSTTSSGSQDKKTKRKEQGKSAGDAENLIKRQKSKKKKKA